MQRCNFGAIRAQKNDNRARAMISQAIIQLCQAVRAAGGRALLVGGWVRDFARGPERLPEHLNASVDYDIEVYGVEAAALRTLLEGQGKVDAVGEAFTV